MFCEDFFFREKDVPDGRVRQNRKLITAERCRTENIDDVKYVLHERLKP